MRARKERQNRKKKEEKKQFSLDENVVGEFAVGLVGYRIYGNESNLRVTNYSTVLICGLGDSELRDLWW